MKQLKLSLALVPTLLCCAVHAEETAKTPSPAKSVAPAAKTGEAAAKKEGGSVDITHGLDIIGSQDAPLELNIVPWKDKESHLPKNPLDASVLDETLEPIDRDVVRREVDFSQALQAPTP